MTIIQIDKFIAQQSSGDKPVMISFKNRNAVIGIFVRGRDFDDLKAKNFWRIIAEADLASWKRSKDQRLSRLFSGTEFVKLAAAT